MHRIDKASFLWYHNLCVMNIIRGCGGTADALVSGSSEEIRVGSNPVIRTKRRHLDFRRGVFALYVLRDLKGKW